MASSAEKASAAGRFGGRASTTLSTSCVAAERDGSGPTSTTARVSPVRPGGTSLSTTKMWHEVLACRSRSLEPPEPISRPSTPFSTSSSWRRLPGAASASAMRLPTVEPGSGQFRATRVSSVSSGGGIVKGAAGGGIECDGMGRCGMCCCGKCCCGMYPPGACICAAPIPMYGSTPPMAGHSVDVIGPAESAGATGVGVAVPRSICRASIAAISAVAVDTCTGVPMSTTSRWSSAQPGGGCSSNTNTSHPVRSASSRLVEPCGPITLPMIFLSTRRSCRTLPATASRCAIRSPHRSVAGGQPPPTVVNSGSSPPMLSAVLGSITTRTSAAA
mmetsp:Transcript_52220/g.120096  ORF Transcript_52220/g.120096 Transcript_52220/m.120096 type:complete len:331 (+) Transcript_52220:873-1865(+)